MENTEVLKRLLNKNNELIKKLNTMISCSNDLKEELSDIEIRYCNLYEKLEDVKTKNLFQLIKWWFKN